MTSPENQEYIHQIAHLYTFLALLTTSSETQGQLVGAGESLIKRGRKNSGEEKTFFPRIFSRPFRLFPAPTNCPWVSERQVNITPVKLAGKFDQLD